MSSHDFIEEILTLYLCRIIETIVLFILMIIRLKKLVSLYRNILMKRKYLLTKSNLSSMMLTKKPCKIFIKGFISIAKMVKLLGWLMGMIHWMEDRCLNFTMLFCIKENLLYFTVTSWKLHQIQGLNLDLEVKFHNNISKQDS